MSVLTSNGGEAQLSLTSTASANLIAVMTGSAQIAAFYVTGPQGGLGSVGPQGTGNINLSGYVPLDSLDAMSGYVMGVSGGLQSEIVIDTTNLTSTGQALYAHDTLVSGIAISGIFNSGATLYALVTGTSGQAISDYAAKISLTQTGLAIQLSGSQAWNVANNNAANLSGNATQTGVQLTARDTLISGIATTGDTVSGATLYGYIVGLSGALGGGLASIANLALTGSGLYSLATGTSGQASIDYATKASLTATGLSIQTTGQQAWIAADNNARVMSGNLTQTGIQLGSTIALSGAGLYALATGLSGQLNINHATVANLALTGSGLYSLTTGLSGQANANYGTITNLALTGSGLFSLMTGASGQSVLDYATKTALTTTGLSIQTTGSQAWSAADNNGRNISGNLTQTGVQLITSLNALSGYVTGVSGGLQSQITAGGGTQFKVTGSNTLPTANITGVGTVTLTLSGSTVIVSGTAAGGGVSAVNSLAGAIFATGTGSVTVWTLGQNLVISGDTSISGALTQTGLSIQTTGQQAWTAADVNARNISGNQTQTGIQLQSIIGSTGQQTYNLITSLSGQLNNSYASTGSLLATGQVLYAYVIATSGTIGITGATLYNLITALSGQSNTSYATTGNLLLTGQALYAYILGTSGAVGVTGTSLYNLITALSGQLNNNLATTGNLLLTGQALYTYITATSGAVGVSGTTLYNLMTALSGQLNNNHASTGSLLATGQALYSYVLGTSGAIGATGTTLYNLITALSGQANANYATVPNLALTGSGLYTLVTNLSGQLNNNHASTGNLLLTGQSLYSYITATSGAVATTGMTLYNLLTALSGQANTNYATVVNLASTGQQAWTTADNNARTTSGNVTQTGVQLQTIIGNTGQQVYNLITALSGQANTNYATINSLNALSGYVTGVSGGLQAQITAANGTAIKVTGSANLTTANFTGLGSTLVYLSGGFVVISGAAGGGGGITQGQLDSLSGWSASATNLAFTGTNLYALVTGTSGQANTAFATTGNLLSSGQTLYSYILGTSGAIGATGTTLYNLLTALSGQANTNYALKSTFVGTGGLSVTQVGTVISISGLTTTTGQQVVFMNKGGVLSGATTFLWDETSNVLAVAKNRLHNSGITLAGTDSIFINSGVILSQTGFISLDPRYGGNAIEGVTGIANRPIPNFIESGLQRSQMLFGPAMWSRQFTAILPATTTSQTVLGNTAANVGTLSTLSSEVLGQYTNLVSAGTVFTAAGTQATTPYFFRGTMTGRNGFFFSSTFCLADGNNTSGAYNLISGSRIFIGMTDQVTSASVLTNDPAGNRVGLSFIAASGGTQAQRQDRDWLISAKNNITEFTGSAGMNFLTGFYRFSMYSPPFAANNTGVFWQLDDLIRGSGTNGVITGNLPIGSTAMGPSAYVCAVSGGARNLRMINLYAENVGST